MGLGVVNNQKKNYWNENKVKNATTCSNNFAADMPWLTNKLQDNHK